MSLCFGTFLLFAFDLTAFLSDSLEPCEGTPSLNKGVGGSTEGQNEVLGGWGGHARVNAGVACELVPQ